MNFVHWPHDYVVNRLLYLDLLLFTSGGLNCQLDTPSQNLAKMSSKLAFNMLNILTIGRFANNKCLKNLQYVVWSNNSNYYNL